MLPPPQKPRRTSINLIISSDSFEKYTALVNAGQEYYTDGLPVELYSRILSAVCDTIDEWNDEH